MGSLDGENRYSPNVLARSPVPIPYMRFPKRNNISMLVVSIKIVRDLPTVARSDRFTECMNILRKNSATTRM